MWASSYIDVVDNGPVGEFHLIAQVAEVVNVTEELVLELNILDFGDWTELKEGKDVGKRMQGWLDSETDLVQCTCVGVEARREVRQVQSNLFNQISSEMWYCVTRK